MFRFLLSEPKIIISKSDFESTALSNLLYASFFGDQVEMLDLIYSTATEKYHRKFPWSCSYNISVTPNDRDFFSAISLGSFGCLDWFLRKKMITLQNFGLHRLRSSTSEDAFRWVWKRRKSLGFKIEMVLSELQWFNTSSYFFHFFMEEVDDADWIQYQYSTKRFVEHMITSGLLSNQLDHLANHPFATQMIMNRNWKILRALIELKCVSPALVKNMMTSIYSKRKRIEELLQNPSAKAFIDWLKNMANKRLT